MEITTGDIIFNTNPAHFKMEPYIVMICKNKVKLLTSSLHPDSSPNNIKKVWYGPKDVLLCNYYDIPKGMKRNIIKMFKSPDYTVVNYAINICKNFRA